MLRTSSKRWRANDRGRGHGDKQPWAPRPTPAESRWPRRPAQRGERHSRPVRVNDIRGHPATQACVAQHSSHGHLESDRCPEHRRETDSAVSGCPEIGSQRVSLGVMALSDPPRCPHPQGPPGRPSSTHPPSGGRTQKRRRGCFLGGGCGGRAGRGGVRCAFSSKGSCDALRQKPAATETQLARPGSIQINSRMERSHQKHRVPFRVHIFRMQGYGGCDP